ncbi:MAG TPA: CoA-binding protein [Chloroflexota bacterium]|nr:CoA-binding protein [Chloroflexota bacterium]
MSTEHRLSPLFKFSSVAMVGASDNSAMGGRPYQALQSLGFTGRYYPINARNDRVHGLQAYPNVSSCPEPPEMVVIAIPREGVPTVVDECARVGVKAAVILAAGFVDLDTHGAELQAQVSETARKSGLLVIGPNCLGLASVVNKCAASSAAPPTELGNVALISHSGGLMNEVISCGVPRGIGFSHVVSAGNEVGVNAADLIDFFVDDPATDVILSILETARDPERFAKACARAAESRKPIVLLKMGRTPRGARSAYTHTGANAGDDAAYTTLFRQYGIVQVNDIDELVDMGALLSASIGVLRRRRLERTAIIEISGGGKELLCDTAAAAGVELPEPSPAALEALTKGLPEDTYPTNPIDTGGSWVQPDKAVVYPLTLDVFASEPAVDVIVSRYTIPRTGELGVLRDRLAELDAARAAHPDRLFPVLSRTCDQFCEEWEQVVRERRIPFLQGYGRGMRALGLLAEYSRFVHGPALDR